MELERGETRDAISALRDRMDLSDRALRDRMDLSDRDATSAWTDLSERITNTLDTAPPVRVEQVEMPVAPAALTDNPAPVASLDGAAQVKEDWSGNHWGQQDSPTRYQ